MKYENGLQPWSQRHLLAVKAARNLLKYIACSVGFEQILFGASVCGRSLSEGPDGEPRPAG